MASIENGAGAVKAMVSDFNCTDSIEVGKVECPLYVTQNSSVAMASKKQIAADMPIHTHTMPDVGSADLIVGILNVPMHEAGPEHMGYHVHDFFAFKSLFADHKKDSQTWLSMVRPTQLVETYGFEAYQNGGCLEGKNPLLASDASNTSDAVSLTYENSPQKLLVEILIQIQLSARVAMNRLPEKPTRCLNIMAFGPATPEQDIILDMDRNIILTSEMIRQALPSGVRVTLFTPAVFSSGWLLNPHFSVVGPWIEDKHVDLMMAKHCGGALTQAALNYFQTGGNPFLTEEATNEIGRGRPPINTKMTDTMRACGRVYHEAIRSTMRSHFAKNPKKHFLNFDDNADEWTESVCIRTGCKLSEFEKKLSAIGDAVFQAQVPGDHFEFLGKAFGGTVLSQVNHIKRLVKTFMMMTSVDSQTPEERDALNIFRDFLATKPEQIFDEVAADILSNVEYRFATMTMATWLVDALQLPRPLGDRCSIWSVHRYTNSFARLDAALYKTDFAAIRATSPIFNEMSVDYRKVNDSITKPNFGRFFWRPSFYVANALAINFKEKPEADMKQYVREKLNPTIETLRVRVCEELAKLPLIAGSGIDWYKSMGFATIDPPANYKPTVQIEKVEKVEPTTFETVRPAQSLQAPGSQLANSIWVQPEAVRATCSSASPTQRFQAAMRRNGVVARPGLDNGVTTTAGALPVTTQTAGASRAASLAENSRRSNINPTAPAYTGRQLLGPRPTLEQVVEASRIISQRSSPRSADTTGVRPSYDSVFEGW